MYAFGHSLLPRAALAQDENGIFMQADLLNDLIDALHALGNADETAEAWARAQLLAQQMIFLLQLDSARRALQTGAQFLNPKRFGYIIHGPKSRRGYSGINRSILRQHDDRQHGVAVVYALQQIQPTGLLQHQVRQHYIHRGVLQYFQSLFGAGYGYGLHSRLARNLGASLPDRRLIVDDEDVHRDGFA